MFKEAAQLEHEIATPFVGGAPDQFATKALATRRASENYTSATFMGWRRENGRVGVRNHVVLLPLDDLSNAACEAVANNVKGTMALPHAYGRLQFGEDLDLHFRTLIGIGSNPNVAAVVVIGIEDQWTNRVVEGLTAGTDMLCVVTADDSSFRLKSRMDVPIGHKIALTDIKTGDTVWKYGQDIGKAVSDIAKGDHVHVHNLKTKRW